MGYLFYINKTRTVFRTVCGYTSEVLNVIVIVCKTVIEGYSNYWTHTYVCEKRRNMTNIFAVEPKSYIIPLAHDIRDAATRHDSYKVYNIGHADVVIGLLSATGQYWSKVEEQTTVKPGHTLIIDNVGKFSFITGIKISNITEKRAIVYCANVDGSGSDRMVTIDEPDEELDFNGNFENASVLEPVLCDEDKHLEDPQCSKILCDEGLYEYLNATYNIGVKYIDYINQKYQGLLNEFWPDNSLSICEEILRKLQPLLDKEVLRNLSSILNKFMPLVREQLIIMSGDHNNNFSQAGYMKLAENLSDIEEKLISELQDYKDKSNLFLLPLFSNFVFLKVTFYVLGVINMPYTDHIYIKNHLRDTINKATTYIKSMSEYHIEHTYNTSNPECLYNSLMNVRTYVIIHGLEYLSIWDNMAQYPLGGTKGANVGQISYSSFFGRQTPNLVREATALKMHPPLTPSYYDLKGIQIYLWRSRFSQQSPKIGGIKLTFSDWSSYIMGTESEEYEEFELGEAYIIKLEVTGIEPVDSLRFFMSDGRRLSFGTVESDSKKGVFELKDHMIVSMFLSSDDSALEGQAANIAVAYNKVVKCKW